MMRLYELEIHPALCVRVCVCMCVYVCVCVCVLYHICVYAAVYCESYNTWCTAVTRSPPLPRLPPSLASLPPSLASPSSPSPPRYQMGYGVGPSPVGPFTKKKEPFFEAGASKKKDWDNGFVASGNPQVRTWV